MFDYCNLHRTIYMLVVQYKALKFDGLYSTKHMQECCNYKIFCI